MYNIGKQVQQTDEPTPTPSTEKNNRMGGVEWEKNEKIQDEQDWFHLIWTTWKCI